jgi:hypothetical protein
MCRTINEPLLSTEETRLFEGFCGNLEALDLLAPPTRLPLVAEISKKQESSWVKSAIIKSAARP